METPEEIRVRWRYLRDLLIDQLGQVETGLMQMHEAGLNVSTDAVWILKQNIQEFDTLILRARRARVHARGATNASLAQSRHRLA